ncbi:hypothetical protein, partial [Mycoplasma phocimorsus]|uniref:hypothetical protein n=1 Tax=Mycoplasma phocimorsus TaxID=3045839 RepID=UPI0024BFCAD0
MKKLILLSLGILCLPTVVSCETNKIRKEKAKKVIIEKLNNQNKQFQINKKRTLNSLLLSENKYLNNYSTLDLNLEKNDDFIKKTKSVSINSILKSKRILVSWAKRAKKTLKGKKILNKGKGKRNVFVIAGTTISVLLISSAIIGSSVYLLKYNRNLLNNTKANFFDFIFKKYLTFSNVNIELGNSFKNLLFSLFKENDFKDRALIDFFIKETKKIIWKGKKITDIFNKNTINEWVKNFSENKKNIENNPISYFYNILKGPNGTKIFEELLKLLFIFSEQKD